MLQENHPILILYNQLIPNTFINTFKRFNIGFTKSKLFLFEALADFKNFFKNYYKDFLNNTSLRPPFNSNQCHHWSYPDLEVQINKLNHKLVNDLREKWIIWTSSNFLHNGLIKDCINFSLSLITDSTFP